MNPPCNIMTSDLAISTVITTSRKNKSSPYCSRSSYEFEPEEIVINTDVPTIASMMAAINNVDKTGLSTARSPNDEEVRAAVYRKVIEETREKLVASFADRFHEAACVGDVAVLKDIVSEIEHKLSPTPIHQQIYDLLTRHLAINHDIGKHKITPIIGAIYNGFIEVTAYLITTLHADLLQPDELGSLPIHIATEVNQETIVELLLDSKPDLVEEKHRTTNDSALNLAAYHGHLNLVHFLVTKKGANIENKGNFDRTPLMDAALGGHLEIVKFLSELSKNDHSRYMAIYYATMNGHLPVVRLFLAQNPELIDTVHDTKGDWLLHLAAFTGHLKLVQFFVDEVKVDIERRGCSGRTALLSATFRGHCDVVCWLVEKGANLEATDETESRSMAIHLAAQQGDLPIVVYLLNVKPQLIGAQAANNDTPLHRAVQFGKLDVVKLLVRDYHSPVNLKGHKDLTPLMMAAKEGYAEIVEFLVKEAGASLTLASNFGPRNSWLAIHYASCHGHRDVVEVLLGHQPDLLEAREGLDRSPLAISAAFGQVGIVDYLVRCKGADKESRDSSNRTPLQLAIAHHYETVAKFLRDCGAEENNALDLFLAKTRQIFMAK